MRLSLILPTLDERENVAVLVPAILALPFVREIIVVDDGSTDGTRALVLDLATRDPRVRLVARDMDRGLARALQAGIDVASGDLVGWMDADRSMDGRDLVRLVQAIDDGADLAVGSRFTPGGTIKGQEHHGVLGRARALASLPPGESRIAGALSWGLNTVLLPALLGGAPHDYTSGFLVGRRSVVRAHRLRGDHGEYFMTLWIDAERDGARIDEVPCRIAPRAWGETKTAPSLGALGRRGLRYLRAAAALRFRS
jgi:dolichol-phosphate mannosyltransferase